MKQKTILIQGAMDTEIALLKQKIESVEEININGYYFYKGYIKNIRVILSKTQIGLINVTAATLTAILNFSPYLIINQGVAGGITKKVHKGDIILGESCININSFQTPYKEKGEGSNSLDWELKTFKEGIDELVISKASKSLLNLSEKVADKENIKHYIGRIGSGDVWNAEKDRLLWLSKKYEVLCEDMETIGAYQIAERFKIPVLGVRILSDNLLLDEEYDKSVGKIGQEFVFSIIKELIQEDKI